MQARFGRLRRVKLPRIGRLRPLGAGREGGGEGEDQDKER